MDRKQKVENYSSSITPNPSSMLSYMLGLEPLLDEDVGYEVVEHTPIPVAVAPTVFAEVLKEDIFPTFAVQATPLLPPLPPIYTPPAMLECDSHVSSDPTQLPPLVPELPPMTTTSHQVYEQYAQYPPGHRKMAQTAHDMSPLPMPHQLQHQQQQQHQQVTMGTNHTDSSFPRDTMASSIINLVTNAIASTMKMSIIIVMHIIIIKIIIIMLIIIMIITTDDCRHHHHEDTHLLRHEDTLHLHTTIAHRVRLIITTKVDC
jgi:hypothetical protein